VSSPQVASVAGSRSPHADEGGKKYKRKNKDESDGEITREAILRSKTQDRTTLESSSQAKRKPTFTGLVKEGARQNKKSIAVFKV
jgi:hypothetical protein